MRGKKEGMYIGFACGLLLDIFGSGILGFYALLYMYIGYINGCFRKMFYPEDLKLPMLLIAGSDLGCNLIDLLFLVFVPQFVIIFNIICGTSCCRNLSTPC